MLNYTSSSIYPVSSSKSSYSKSDDVIYSVELNRLGQSLGMGLHG